MNSKSTYSNPSIILTSKPCLGPFYGEGVGSIPDSDKPSIPVQQYTIVIHVHSIHNNSGPFLWQQWPETYK